ncbi:MAG: hypothetical protein FJZ96_01730 [Chloroflexi bacterium]|nr:hypothetical protein [Chloroflexota bacterium]
MTILDIPLIARLRRNHGLEHATLTLLSQRFPGRPMAGLSTHSGFYLFGDISTADLQDAVIRALVRLTNGERRLAVHPHCGTNYAVSGFVAGLLAWFGMAGAGTRRDKAERLPLVMALATLGFILSRPLGPKVQERITASGDPQGLTVTGVFPARFGSVVLHRVATKG